MGLMRLILSLYKGKAWSYSIPVYIWGLDEIRLQRAKSIFLDYLDHGETVDLLQLACKFAHPVGVFFGKEAPASMCQWLWPADLAGPVIRSNCVISASKDNGKQK
jgi:hypothetical protein